MLLTYIKMAMYPRGFSRISDKANKQPTAGRARRARAKETEVGAQGARTTCRLLGGSLKC